MNSLDQVHGQDWHDLVQSNNPDYVEAVDLLTDEQRCDFRLWPLLVRGTIECIVERQFGCEFFQGGTDWTQRAEFSAGVEQGSPPVAWFRTTVMEQR